MCGRVTDGNKIGMWACDRKTMNQVTVALGFRDAQSSLLDDAETAARNTFLTMGMFRVQIYFI